ncbi:hypothetical protein ACFX2I_031040 [Malus domestica]
MASITDDDEEYEHGGAEEIFVQHSQQVLQSIYSFQKIKLKYDAFPVYAITCFPVAPFGTVHILGCVDLIRWTTFNKVPQRRSHIIHS